MRKRGKKLLAGILIFALTLGTAYPGLMAAEPVEEIPANHETQENDAELATQDVEIVSDSSFGDLVANSLQESEDDAETVGGNRIAEIRTEGTTANVRYQTEQACDLVVALYDESGTKMLGSNTVKTTAGAGTTAVDLSHITEWPQYYLVKAYMLDPYDHHALCEEYTDDSHTQAFQEFISKTADDFPDSEVLNLDEDTTTNFAVFKQETLIINEADGSVQVEDHGDGTYTFSGDTQDISGLTTGQPLVYRYRSGELLILVVSESSADSDGTVTVTDDTTADLETVFEYVKIEGKNGQVEIDDSTLSEGVTRKEPLKTMAADSGEVADSDKITNNYSFGTKLDVTFSVTTQVDVYVGFGRRMAETRIISDLLLDGEMDVGISADKEFQNLSKYAISPVAGVYITFVPGVKFETNGKINLNVNVTSTIGFGYDSDREGNPFYNLTTGPEMNRELNAEITVYIGLTLTPQVKVLSDKVAKASVTAEVGGTITVKAKKTTGDDSYRHECDECLAGEVHASGSLTGEITFAKKDPLSKTWKIDPVKVGEFYWSFSKNEHGKGVCPHIIYKVAIDAVDADGNPVAAAKVTIQKDGKQLGEVRKTDENGSFKEYLAPGKYFFIFQKDSLLATQFLTVDKDAQSHKVVMEDKGCGENLYWSLDDGGTLSIIGTGPMFDWTSYKNVPWYENRSKVKTLYISEGVTHLGDYAFYGCPGSSCELKLPDSLISIGNYTFGGALGGFQFTGELHFPDQLTSIGAYAFEKAGSNSTDNYVTEVTFGQNLKEIGKYAFYSFRCSCELSIPDSLEEIPAYAFLGSQFKGLTLGNRLKTIGASAFEGCRNLKGSLVIPDSVETISDKAFSDCGKFDGQLTIGKGVKTIGNYAFGAYGQASIWEGDGFTGELRIPGNVKTIGAGAFRNNKGLTSLVLENGVEAIGEEAFNLCESLTNNLVIPDTMTTIGKNAFNGCDFHGLTLGKGLKSIGALAFYNCKNMKCTLTFPEGLESLGGFGNCTGITGTIVIPESVTEITNYAFSECTGLTGPLSLPSGLKSIGDYAFTNCSGLTGSLDLPSGVTSIGKYAFSGCSGLSGNLKLPEGLGEVDYAAFQGCTGLTGELVLPSSLKTIDNSGFKDCSGFTSLTLNTNLRSIWFRAFNNCTGLNEIWFPGKAPSIESGAFDGVTATAWYPAGNTTYTDSLKERAGGNLTWTEYTPTAAVLADESVSIDPAEASSTEEEPVSDEALLPQDSDAAEHPEATEEIEEQETMAISAVGGSVSVDSDQVTASFSDLIPDNSYVVLAVRSNNAWDMTGRDNLLYISQEKADSNGKLSVTFTPVEMTDVMSVQVYGGVNWDLGNASVSLSKKSFSCTGSACTPTVTVKYGGKTLKRETDYTLRYENNINVGTASAIVTGIGDYTGEQTATFTIVQGNQNIGLSYEKNQIKTGETMTITASALTPVSFTSAKPDTASVSSPVCGADGKTWTATLTGNAAGSTQITVTAEETANFHENTKIFTVYVTAAGSSSSDTPSGGNTGNSGNTGSDGNTDSSGNTDSNQNIEKAVKTKSIMLSGISGKIAAGKKITLSANVLPKNATDKSLRWSSSKNSVATVTQKGIVSVNKKAGGKSVTIYAKALDGSGVTGAFKIKVMKGTVKKITLSGKKKVKAGKSIKLKAKVKAAKGANKKLKWTSSNTKYATVSASGKVKALPKGKGRKVKITAMSTDGSGKKAVKTIRIK